MAQELVIEGKTYISSKRASKESGYAQDYIGQLARKGLIDARRVGGLWYVFFESLAEYKKQAELFTPQPPVYHQETRQELDTIVSFDGRDYVSAARAAEITGYHQDYVGQLARAGSILARQVGTRWYVDRESLLAHKGEKDAMLAAVQVESVGLHREVAPAMVRASAPAHVPEEPTVEPEMRYFTEDRDLMPHVRGEMTESTEAASEQAEPEPTPIPIRVRSTAAGATRPEYAAHPSKRRFVLPVGVKLLATAGVAATVVVVLAVGTSDLNKSTTYASAGRSLGAASAAAVQGIADSLLDAIEKYLSSELIYRRSVPR